VGPPRTVDTVSKRLYFQVRNQCHRMRSCRSTPVKKSPTSLRRFSKFFCSLLYFCSTSATPQSLLPLLFLLLLLVSTPPPPFFSFSFHAFFFFLFQFSFSFVSAILIVVVFYFACPHSYDTYFIPYQSFSLRSSSPPPNEKLRTFQYSQKNR